MDEAVYRNETGEFKIENLPAGEYSFIAAALKDGKIIRRKNGNFTLSGAVKKETPEQISIFDAFASVFGSRFYSVLIFIPIFSIMMILGTGRGRLLFELKKFIFVWKNYIRVLLKS